VKPGIILMGVPPFWQEKYRKEAGKNWDKFYKRNNNRFFKDRHWLQREFPDLSKLTREHVLLEVGCGVGNLVFPVQQETGCHVIAADFSSTAINILKEDNRYDSKLIEAVVHDFTLSTLKVQSDLATMIFVLSAVPPEKHAAFLKNVSQSSNSILFRDYAVEDAAQKRFADNNKLSEVLYVRQDGTLAYYFDLEYLMGVAAEAGLTIADAQYVISETVNIKEGLHVPRRFLQCKFMK
jgi:methyltransferase-like protein 6